MSRFCAPCETWWVVDAEVFCLFCGRAGMVGVRSAEEWGLTVRRKGPPVWAEGAGRVEGGEGVTVKVPVHADWHRDGACNGRDVNIWFPDPGGSVALAMSICWGCPVKAVCLEEAVANGEQYGVFGGATADDRRRLSRRPRNGMSPERVRAIREEHKVLFDQGVTGARDILASRYGMSRSNVGLLVTGRTYPDYPGPIHQSSRTRPLKRNRAEVA